MLLGLAIGDALGNPTEGWWSEDRRAQFGEIRGYLKAGPRGESRGYPSDDTQLAFWTLEQLIDDGRFEPARLARRFATGWIFGIGQTVEKFQLNFQAGKSWELCGPPATDRSCGSRLS